MLGEESQAMNQLPICLQYIQALGLTVVAIIAAGIAGYIAWRQWRTAHYRLSFDLYEKRFKVYEAINLFITRATAQERYLTHIDIEALHNGIRGGEFLFGGDARKLVNDIAKMAVDPAMARQTDKLSPEVTEYLSKQSLEDIFRPYLDLSKAGLKG
jgi:hypothetical protein